MLSTSQPFTVVLQVDDSPEEPLFMGYAFAEAGVGDRYRAVSSGQEALDYLEGRGDFADREQFPLPCLVLLDIEMPRMDGFEVLARIRARPQTRDLPVSMYTTSSESSDIQRALQLGADCFIRKPFGLQAERQLAREIADAWFSPTPSRPCPRILLRKRRILRNEGQAGFYLQPDGTWSASRESARQFAHTVDAQWWAEEQEHLDAEVILASSDPGQDYGCIRV